MSNLYRYTLTIFVLALFAQHARLSCANTFTELVAFGASLTDGGNVFEASPPFFEGEHVPPSPPYHNGRFSNGPNYADVLAELLDVGPLEPSERGGTNYAWGAATSGLVVLDDRVTQIDRQVAQFLRANTPRPDQLFLFGLVNDFDPRIGHTDVAASASYMREQMQSIIDAGGRHFVIANLPNEAEIFTQYNQQLHRVVDELRSAEVSVYELDLGAVVDNIIANPADYGITNTISPACRVCGGGGNPDATIGDVVGNPDEYLLFDFAHYSASVNRVIGEAAFDATRILLNEDFSSGDLDGWTLIDTSSQPILQPWGPGTAEIQNERLHFETAGDVPARESPSGVQTTGAMILALDRSQADQRFANGYFRTTVRADTASNANVMLRGDLETFSGYVFASASNRNEFVINRFVNGVGEELAVGGAVDGLNFGVGEEWSLEVGAIGNELSLKAWRVGEDEPVAPQLVVRDDQFTSGQIGLISAVEAWFAPGPVKLDVTFDDLVFRIGESATDLSCDFDGDGGCDADDLNELQYIGLGRDDLTYDLNNDGVVDSTDTIAWLNQKGTFPGDADLDGDVDSADLNAVGSNWQSRNALSWGDADFDGNRIVDSKDLNLLGSNWQVRATATSSMVVPEPTGFQWWAVVTAWFLVRVRSRVASRLS